MRKVHWIAPFLLVVSVACAKRQTVENRSGCLAAGRRDECRLTIGFDAATERFQYLEAEPIGDGTGAAATHRDTIPLPVLQRPIPILTGDVLTVRVDGLPLGESVTASASSQNADPFPRPGIGELPSLGKFVWENFASPIVHAKTTGTQSGHRLTENSIEQPTSKFAALWKEDVREPLKSSTDDLRAEIEKVAPLVAQLANQGAILTTARADMTTRMNGLKNEIDGAGATLQRACTFGASTTDNTPEQANGSANNGKGSNGHNAKAVVESSSESCLRALYAASALQTRQDALVKALEKMVSGLQNKDASATAQKIEQLFARSDVRKLLDVDLKTPLAMATPGIDDLPPVNMPLTGSQLKGARDALQATPVINRVKGEEGVEAAEAVEVRTLLTNVTTAQQDFAALQKYEATRRRLQDMHAASEAAGKAVREFREAFDNESAGLLIAMTNLAFEFDRGAARRGDPLLVPVFRTTKNETVTISITRSARFATTEKQPPPPPSKEGDKPKQEEAGAVKAATPAATSNGRQYTHQLLARKKEYFQVTAGFLFSGVRSSTFGVNDVEVEAGEAKETQRFITETEQRARKFVPSALLVFHPFGKDVHPDAYRTSAALIPGIAMGATFDDPLDNFVAGLAFEPLPGVHFSSGWYFAQVQKLQEGFKEGDQIPTTSDKAPTRNARSDDWYVAAMFDVDVFAKFFGKLFGGN